MLILKKEGKKSCEDIKEFGETENIEKNPSAINEYKEPENEKYRCINMISKQISELINEIADDELKKSIKEELAIGFTTDALNLERDDINMDAIKYTKLDFGEEDVPERYYFIVESIGIDAFKKLVKTVGGESIYIPSRKTMTKNARIRCIAEALKNNNYDYTKVGMIFGISESQVRYAESEYRKLEK